MKKIALPILMLLTVLCAATAQSATNVWVDHFTLNVTKQGILTVSTNRLTFPAKTNETTTGSLTLSNEGNIPMSYTVTGDAAFSTSPYASSGITSLVASASTFYSTNFESETVLTNLNTAIPLGFTNNFGGEFSEVTIKKDGTLTPDGNAATLTTGYSGDDFDMSEIRYTSDKDTLKVAWGVDPNNTTGDSGQLQLWIHANGTVDVLTDTDSGWQKVTKPAWIFSDPASGSIQPQQSTDLTFIFNAEDEISGQTRTFDGTIQSADDDVAIEVLVEIVDSTTDLGLPSSATIAGPAGLISSSSVTLTNTGAAALSYAINYSAQNSFSATQIPYDNNWIAGGSVLEEGYTELTYPIVFLGTPYDRVLIYGNGGIALDPAVDPFFAFTSTNLVYSDNATITLRESRARTVISWNDLSGSESGENYTFQAIFNRDGSIRVNYQSLGSDWQDPENSMSGVGSALYDFFTDENTILTTNEVITETIVTNDVIGNGVFSETVLVTNETVTTEYVDVIERQSARFSPPTEQIITASPLSGVLDIGETAPISLSGDGRDLTAPASVSSTLTVSYEGGSKDLPVTFNVSNSVAAAALSAKAVQDMWGTSFVPNITEQSEEGGARTIRWPAPEQDGNSRTYQVLYTPSLSEAFEPIPGAVFTDVFEFVDTDPVRTGNAQGYYKVSVQ